MDREELVRPPVPEPKKSGIPKWLIIVLIFVVLGVIGYLYYAHYISKETTIDSPNKSDKSSENLLSDTNLISLDTTSHTYEKINLKFSMPKDWLLVSKESDQQLYAKYYYDNDIVLFPTSADKGKEEAFKQESLNRTISNPDDVKYLQEHPGYERVFTRESRFIASTYYIMETVESIDLRADDRVRQSESVFDKILVDDKKINGNEYHCLQSTKDQKFGIYCNAKVGENYLATFSLFTNYENYNDDLDRLYEIIETTVIQEQK